MNAQATAAKAAKRAPVTFDEKIGATLVKYGRMVVARGYIHNTLGNIAIRVPHPDYEHGVAYTKPSGVSLEEVEIQDLVITDIPTSTLLYGTTPTSVGHNLNREILRLRPDINAVIHVHHDETLAYFATGGKEIKAMSLEYPYVLGKDPYVVPSNLDVELDVGPIKEFVHKTNTIVMIRHGMTTMGRHVSEAYHRLNSLTSEVRRNVLADMLASIKNTRPEYLDRKEVEWMYEQAETVIYPTSNT